MYKIKETDSALEVRSKTAMGFVWTGLFLTILLLSMYMGFEYISVKSERPIEQLTQISKKGNKSIKETNSEAYFYMTHFSFQEGFRTDSIALKEILRMDKGYSSSRNESTSTFHYNPTLITILQKPYPLRRISDIAFTPEVISAKVNKFIIDMSPFVSAWDWFMGYWGIGAGVSFIGLLFLSVSGRYQVACFDKDKHTFSIKNYGLLGFVGEEGNWKDIKRIIYQDKKTVHKKGIFFLVRRKVSNSDKKYKTKKVYFTHHTDQTSKQAAQRVADLIRPIAKPNSEKNKNEI